MKKYKDGKIVEASTEEMARIQKRFPKFADNANRSVGRVSFHELYAKVKALEETIATILAAQNTESNSNEV